MGLLRTGLAWLAEVFVAESITVKYLRNGIAYSILAFPSSQVRNADGLGQSQLTVNAMDRVYSIRVSNWTAAGLLSPPEHGDKIEEWTGSTRTGVFEVLPTANEPAWTWGEPEQLTYSINAVRTRDGSTSCRSS